MNCEVCGTELPQGAMFCGECGRAVGVRAAQLRHVDSDMPVESGHARSTANDTVIIEAGDLEAFSLGVQPEAEPELLPDPGAPRDWEPEPEPEPFDEAVEQDLPPDLIEPEIEDAASIAPESPGGTPWSSRASAIFTDAEDLEQTLIVPRREQGERFVLQFSTGESVTVFGSGLLGRNPVPQPGEYFDQLVAISDPGKSVSKTHLEFGQEAASFWVSDRYSGNGSIVREPEASPRRLTSGKRYRIVRGTRVDIGEQFFIVS